MTQERYLKKLNKANRLEIVRGAASTIASRGSVIQEETEKELL